jgi:hypothetical protein
MTTPAPFAAPPQDGTRLRELTDLLCSALPTEAELEMIVSESLHVALHTEYVPDGLTLRQTASALIRALDERGITPTLLHAVLAARPARGDLREVVARYHPEAVPTDTDTKVTEVGRALEAAARGLGDPAVRAQVEESRGSVERLRAQVEVLACYKELHDCLHQIQLKHFRQVADAARRFRTDSLAGGTLEEYLDQLRIVASDAREAALRLPDTPSARPQELLWVSSLDSVAAGLRTALDTLEDGVAREAIRKLKSILFVEPFRINHLLALTAQELPLNRLLETLRGVAQAVGAQSALTRDLEAGIAALEALIPDLLGHVREHWAWQEVEKELWLAEEEIHRGVPEAMPEFASAWSGITRRVQVLAAADPTAPWAVDVTRFEADLRAALAAEADAGVPVRSRMGFDRYRRSVLFRFYLVDKALKEKCGKVTAIGEPLDNLLRQVPDGSP